MSENNKTPHSNDEELELDLEPDILTTSSDEEVDLGLDPVLDSTPTLDLPLQLDLEDMESDEFELELEDIRAEITKGVSSPVLLESPGGTNNKRTSSGLTLRKEDRALTSPLKTKKYLIKLYSEGSDNIKALSSKALDTPMHNKAMFSFESFIRENKPPNIPTEILGDIKGFVANGGLRQNYTTRQIVHLTKASNYVKSDIDENNYKTFLLRISEEYERTKQNIIEHKKIVDRKSLKLRRDYFFKDLDKLAPRLDGEEQIFFVEKIILKGDSESFKCGNCGEESNAEFPFVSVILTANNDNKKHIPWFTPNVCEHCGAVNSLTDMECKAIEKKLKGIEFKVDTIHSQTRGIPTVVKYKYRNSLIADALPDVFVIDNDISYAPEDISSGDISEAIKRYKEKVLAFYSKSSIRQVHRTRLDNIKLLSRTLSSVVGHVYDTIKLHAVNSLIMYIQSSSLLYDILVGDSTTTNQIFIDNIKFLDKDGLEPYEYETITRNICLDLGVKYESVLKEDGSIDSDKSKQLRKEIDEAANRLRVQIEKDKSLQDITIRYLQRNKILYSYLLISQISTIDERVSSKIASDERLVAWVDEVSELMILNSITEDIIPFWTSKSTNNLDAKINRFMGSYDTTSITKKLASILGSLDDTANKTRNSFSKDIKNYLLYYETTITPLRCFRRLRSDFKHMSTFRIMVGLHGCMPLLMQGIIQVPYFADIKNMLERYYKKVTDFVNKYGSTDKDYFKYVFNFLDTDNVPLRSSLLKEYEKHLFIIKPLEGESAEDYYQRYHETASSKAISDDDVIRVEDDEFINEIIEYSAIIYGATHIYDYGSDNTADFRKFILFKDIMMNAINYDIEDVFKCIGINTNFVAYLNTMSSYNLQSNPKELDKDYIDKYLVNCVYPDDELNDLRNDADLSQVEKINEIVSDKDRLLEIASYFGEKERDLLNEYYLA